ncbi:MAG TPA: hypothetical protein EYM84_06370 [Flavobacteriales bacterium]|nr:hypothetical protein [Flavobacteriales bacterium]
MTGDKIYSRYSLISTWAMRLCLFILCAAINPVVSAQDLHVKAELDTNELLIGDHINLILSVQFPEGKILLWPQIGDTIIKEIEVLNRSVEDTSLEVGKDMLIVSRNYTITSFDSGSYNIPPFIFSFLGDTIGEVATDPLRITVKTIDVDTSKVFKDIKSPFEVPYTLDEFIPHIIIAILILISLLLGYLIYKKLRSREKSAPEIIEPVIPPHIIALESLNMLENSKLWQQNKVKLYYSDLTEIIRTYIENRFDIIAMELTTDEIIAAMSYVSASKESKEELGHMLRLADMVKFAKYKPLANEHESCMKKAYDFVNATKHTIFESATNTEDSKIVNLPPE